MLYGGKEEAVKKKDLRASRTEKTKFKLRSKIQDPTYRTSMTTYRASRFGPKREILSYTLDIRIIIMILQGFSI